jgi:hypothetical protein
MANLIFFVYFVIELILKIVGQGMKHFVKDNYNIFDSIVVSYKCCGYNLAVFKYSN